jgi:oligopeptidase A
MNPLLTDKLHCLNFSIGDLTVAQYQEALTQYMEMAEKEHELFCQMACVTRKEMFETLKASDKLFQVWGLLNSMVALTGDALLIDVLNQNSDRIVDFSNRSGLDPRAYELVKGFAASDEFQSCTDIEKRVVHDVISKLEDAGVGLAPEEKAKLTQTQQMLAKKQQEFNQNLSTYQASVGFEVRLSVLDGLPQWALEQAISLGKEKQVKGAWINQTSGLYEMVLQYAHNRKLRRRVFLEMQGAGIAKGYSNREVMNAIFCAKQSVAKQLGYVSYADMALKTNMAKSQDEVLTFLERVNGKARIQAKQERRMMAEFAKQLGIARYDAWDASYVTEKYRQEKLKYNKEELRTFLPVHRVVNNTFAWLGEMFGIDIRPNESVKGWAPGVVFYEVWEGEEQIAAFYLDLYKRDGKKDGAWVNGMQNRKMDKAGQYLPVAMLVCDITKEMTQESKMSWSDIETWFHELGHLMHFCLTKVDEEYYAGFSNVQWDTVEFPSQLFERLIEGEDMLKRISGAEIPKELLDGLRKDKQFLAASGLVRYAQMAEMDMRLFGQSTDKPMQMPTDVEKEVKERWKIRKTISKFEIMPRFAHIFSGGYSAQYYSYQWAEVMSSHGAKAFKSVSDDAITYRKLALAYKKEVLERGGEREMRENFMAWLGEEPQERYLLEELGLNGS